MKEERRNKAMRDCIFFSLFSIPLRREEVNIDHPKVRVVNNHYLLPWMDESMIQLRSEREQRAKDVLAKHTTWFKILASHPGVEMIAVCNSLSWLQASAESDIDLLIITKPGMIWQTRFALASLMALVNKRPTEKTHSERFCLSFFVTSDDLQLQHLKKGVDDVYFSYWLDHIVPVYDPKQLSHHIQRSDRVVQHQFEVNKEHRFFKTLFSMITLPTLAMEKATRWIQKKKFPYAIKQLAKTDSTDVVVSDSMLKLHVGDRRLEYTALFNQRLDELSS